MVKKNLAGLASTQTRKGKQVANHVMLAIPATKVQYLQQKHHAMPASTPPQHLFHVLSARLDIAVMLHPLLPRNMRAPRENSRTRDIPPA
jgi:hypothetical protein